MQAYQNPFQHIKEIINDQQLTNKVKFQQILAFIDSFEGSEAETEYFFQLGYSIPKVLRNAVAKLETRTAIENYIYYLISTQGYDLSQTDIIDIVHQKFEVNDILRIKRTISKARTFKGKVQFDNKT